MQWCRMDDNVRWDDAPSFGPNLGCQVFSPPPESQAYLRLLGPHTGLFYHVQKMGRNSYRPFACLRSSCPFCKKSPPEWKAYFPALLYCPMKRPNWDPRVAEFTAAAFEELAGAVDLKNTRGLVVEVSRGPTRSRVRAKVIEKDTEHTSGLPPTFDVKLVLRRLFGLSRPMPGGDGTVTLVPPAEVFPIDLPPPIKPKLRTEEAPRGTLPTLGTGKYRKTGGAR